MKFIFRVKLNYNYFLFEDGNEALKDHEAAVIAADITRFILNRDYQLSKTRELEGSGAVEL